MFQLNHKTEIIINGIPIQWIPKIELYYPDLPQFPIMYIHTKIKNNRLIGCPVSVSCEIIQDKCNAKFLVFTNLEPTTEVVEKIKDEIENRIGFSNSINKQTVIDCCRGNSEFINILTDLWQYIEKSYGPSIPYGRFYEEIFSIPRFVAAWQPKTGRQSEMRMLYNFMSKFGEEVCLPSDWTHLEYYVIPSYTYGIWKKYKLRRRKNMSSTRLKPVPQYENNNILKETLFIEDIQNGEVNKEVIKTYLLIFTNGIKVIFKLEYIVIEKEKIMVNHVITHHYNSFNKFSKILTNTIITEIRENKYFRYQVMCLEIGDHLKSEKFIVRCV